MEEMNLISITECCAHYDIESSFVTSLEEFGLVEFRIIEEKKYIPADQLLQLEKFIHLHYDLDINMAGLDAISHLLQRLHSLQHEMAAVKNRLRIYE